LKKTIVIFRHGNTKYLQGNKHETMKTACDLWHPDFANQVEGQTFEEDRIRKNTDTLASLLNASKPMKIISSPTGRGIHTSKCISDALVKMGWEMRPIEINNDLIECKNFSLDMYEPMVFGGEVRLNGNVCVVDKNLSNPRNLDEPDYFFHDELHRVRTEIKLPSWYANRLSQFETSTSCKSRMDQAIKLVKSDESCDQFILTTHAGLAAWPVRFCSNDRVKDLKRGSWMAIKSNFEKIHPFAALDFEC